MVQYGIIVRILERRMLKFKACLILGHTAVKGQVGTGLWCSVLDPVPFPLPVLSPQQWSSGSERWGLHVKVVVSVGVEGRFKGWRGPRRDLQHSPGSRAPQHRESRVWGR